ADVPAAQREFVINTVTVTDWLANRDTHPPALGNIVEHRLRSKVPFGALAGAALWSEIPMFDAKRSAVPIFRQRIHDHHGYTTGDKYLIDAGRDLLHARMASEPVRASELDAVLQKVAPAALNAGRNPAGCDLVRRRLPVTGFPGD